MYATHHSSTSKLLVKPSKRRTTTIMSLWLWSRTIVTARGHPRGGCFVLSSIQNQPVPLVTERPTFTSLSPCYFSTSSLLSPSYWDDDCNKPSSLIQKEQMVVGRELSSPAGARLIIVHAISTTTAATTAAPNDGGCVVSVRPSSSTTTIDIYQQLMKNKGGISQFHRRRYLA